jgi:hypothetical protein
MLCSSRLMVLILPADLTAAGLQYVADVTEDWCQVSLQVQRTLNCLLLLL